MKLPHRGIALGLWLSATVVLAGEATRATAEPPGEGEATPPKEIFLVVVQDKAPLMIGEEQVGELAEGTRVRLRQTVKGWSLVRAVFGTNWFEAWVRAAMMAPDSLADVDIKVAPTRPTDVYRDQIVPGRQFLEVRVRFEPTEASPPRAFFRFDDEKAADVFLMCGRIKELPYGFVRQVEGLTRPAFERQEKRQTLIFKPGEPQVETYVFSVPLRTRDFVLTLKDVTVPVPLRRR